MACERAVDKTSVKEPLHLRARWMESKAVGSRTGCSEAEIARKGRWCSHCWGSCGQRRRLRSSPRARGSNPRGDPSAPLRRPPRTALGRRRPGRRPPGWAAATCDWLSRALRGRGSLLGRRNGGRCRSGRCCGGRCCGGGGRASLLPVPLLDFLQPERHAARGSRRGGRGRRRCGLRLRLQLPQQLWLLLRRLRSLLWRSLR